MSGFAPSPLEELYFHEEERRRRAEVRARLDAAATAARERAKIAEAVGTDDELAERVRELGFDGESARAFDLLPLIHVAWADGKIQRGERAAIFQLLERRGIERDHPAGVMVAALLEERPSDDFFAQSTAVLQELLASRPGDARDLVDLCVLIADASGGLLGVGAVNRDERELIREVAKVLGPDAEAEFKRRLG